MMTTVIKSDGRKMPFYLHKVEATCRRAGASPSVARRIARSIEERSYNGIPTREIYRMVLAELAGDTEHPEIKHRYRLKESLMLLGPAGFNFESYMAQILAANGYEVLSLRTRVGGKCVNHEIDLIVSKGDIRFMVECKYHNFAGIFTGLKESMYTHARFLDIREGKGNLCEKEMLVSNTRISQDAIRYAQCVDQQVISWRYPADSGLERLIEQRGLYPITVLKLSSSELEAFARMGLMVAKDLLEFSPDELSSKTGINLGRIYRLQALTRRILPVDHY